MWGEGKNLSTPIKDMRKFPKFLRIFWGGGKKVHEKTYLSIFSTGVMNGYKFFEKRFF
jgi:hypothetical protein